MRRLVFALAAITFAAATPASAQTLPAACQQPVASWQACLDALPADSPWRPLALINLGTEAFLREDYAASVRYYDEARPPSLQIMSDIAFHTFRGAAYWHVERRDEARADADLAYRMLHRDPTLAIPESNYIPQGFNPEMVYVLLLPVWQTGDQERFQSAVAEYQALPAGDWVSYANRSAVLLQIGDLPAALETSERTLAMAPGEPAVLNNHCYILFELQRAAEALPFCERAVAGAPTAAAVRDSLSDVLAALGRCEEAEREIAEARRLDPSSPSYRLPITCSPA